MDVFRDYDARLQEVIRLRRERRETHGTAPDGDSRQNWCPVAAGRPGRERWGCCCRRSGWPTWGVATGTSRSEVAAWARVTSWPSTARSGCSHVPGPWRTAGEGGGNITWKHGEIEALPIDDASVDLALLSQTLHHATDPELVVREATRIVTDGGRVLVLDLAPRDQDWVKERLGDRWLGFERAKLDGMMSDAGLVDVAVRTAIDPAPFGVIVDVGTKPQRAVSQLARRSPSSRSRSRGRR